jgi:hypothetical protein
LTSFDNDDLARVTGAGVPNFGTGELSMGLGNISIDGPRYTQVRTPQRSHASTDSNPLHGLGKFDLGNGWTLAIKPRFHGLNIRGVAVTLRLDF